ncbi:MAG TPA: hypothetical protein ENJ30_10070 [Desulfobulbaceae bacterium]|nr:hypothetical protein [Desulfobulbaceae bacterium]
MIKRYLLTFGAFFLLVIGYLLTLLPLQVIRSDLSTATYGKALLAWGVLVALSFVPAVAMIIKKIWFFHGTGVPISEKELRAALLRVNGLKIPIRVTEKRKQLVVEWRYDDPDWCEHMVAAHVSRLYELHLRFNEATHTVRVTDRYRKVDFDLCPVRVKTGLLALPRPFFALTRRKSDTIEHYGDMAPFDFSYQPKEIKSPLLNSILARGWNVQFTLL